MQKELYKIKKRTKQCKTEGTSLSLNILAKRICQIRLKRG